MHSAKPEAAYTRPVTRQTSVHAFYQPDPDLLHGITGSHRSTPKILDVEPSLRRYLLRRLHFDEAGDSGPNHIDRVVGANALCENILDPGALRTRHASAHPQ